MSTDYLVFKGAGNLTTTERHPQINLAQGATALEPQQYDPEKDVLIDVSASNMNLLVGDATEDASGVFSFVNTIQGDGSAGTANQITIDVTALKTAITDASQISLGQEGAETTPPTAGAVASSWLQFKNSVKELFTNAATDDSLFDDEAFTGDHGLANGLHSLDSTKWLATLQDTPASGDEPASTLKIENLLSLFQDAVERNIVDAAAGGIGASGLSTVDASGREVSDRFLPGDVIYFANGISMTVKLPIETGDGARLSGSFAVVTDPGEALTIEGAVTLPTSISKTYTSDLYVRLR